MPGTSPGMTASGRSHLRRLADLVEPFLQGEPADAGERQAGEDRDAGVEHAVGLGEDVISASGPVAAAGSGTPQCALMGWPGQVGQTSAAALSQTVKTKIHVRRIRAPEVAFRARLR